VESSVGKRKRKRGSKHQVKSKRGHIMLPLIPLLVEVDNILKFGVGNG